MSLPGWARPNTVDVDILNIELGTRSGSIIEWTPLGSYTQAEIMYHWYLPGTISFELKPGHRLIPRLRALRRRAIHIRVIRNGIPWTGRLMTHNTSGNPRNPTIRFTGVDYKFWLQRGLAWVNSMFPPEFQIGLTGKQDVMFGNPDFVLKYFGTKTWVRTRRPICAAMPLHTVTSDYPDLASFNSLDSLLDLVGNAIEELAVISMRFTQLNDGFSLTRDRLDFGWTLDLWDGVGPSPKVFNATTLSQLQSILDVTSDNFLNFTNPNNYLGLTDPSSWGRMPRAGYVFDTVAKQDKRQVQWSTDGTQVLDMNYDSSHATATRAVVGGKAPEILNQVIEWGANFAIQLLLNAIAPGLGLGLVVGDLFDNIFFAYQQFIDYDLEAEIGIDDAFADIFADNTAAYSLDAYATAQGALKEHSGSEAIELTVQSGGADGRGMSFGVDNGSGRRYQLGHIHTFYDQGTTIEQYISSVTVTDKRDGRILEKPILGEGNRIRGAYERLVVGQQSLVSYSRGNSNSV
ncbi:hypothetical protein CH274_15365 [Rhodococcus sp. 06-418-5]|uniref:Gp37-like protein n=1 Tax=Rhodococcus sp. 06-418-5 TaxID=2022507 RepID=UPI000B9BADF9|nr:hypothetical protein [Rhodococcus sp. 06-418-5]OZC80547.1 hypothetical protein CH274_15365 [Rhodococcus sp. 06-418-5]